MPWWSPPRATDAPGSSIYDGLPVILIRAWQDLLLLPGADAAAMAAETRAAALVLGALTRIGVALRNSERVEDLQDQRRTLEASGACSSGGGPQVGSRNEWLCGVRFVHHEAADSSRAAAYADDAGGGSLDDVGVARCAESGGAEVQPAVTADWRACPRRIDTFTFEPALAAVPTAELTLPQRRRLARATLHLERLGLDYWLRVVGRVPAK